jgi:hypothetical protein
MPRVLLNIERSSALLHGPMLSILIEMIQVEEFHMKLTLLEASRAIKKRDIW